MPSEPPRIFIPAPGPLAAMIGGFSAGVVLYHVGLWMLGL